MTKTEEIYSGDLIAAAAKNDKALRTVYTVPGYSQVVVMHISADSSAPIDSLSSTQIMTCVSGAGSVIIHYKESGWFGIGKEKTKNYPLRPHRNVIIPAGLKYNIINTQARPLKLINVISPDYYSAETTIEKMKGTMCGASHQKNMMIYGLTEEEMEEEEETPNEDEENEETPEEENDEENEENDEENENEEETPEETSSSSSSSEEEEEEEEETPNE